MTEFLTWNNKIIEQPDFTDAMLISVLFWLLAIGLVHLFARIVSEVERRFFTINSWDEFILDLIDEEERAK